jgi:hypothetical protein
MWWRGGRVATAMVGLQRPQWLCSQFQHRAPAATSFSLRPRLAVHFIHCLSRTTTWLQGGAHPPGHRAAPASRTGRSRATWVSRRHSLQLPGQPRCLGSALCGKEGCKGDEWVNVTVWV